MDSAELLKRLRAAIRRDEELVPDDWKTAQQLCLEWRMSISHVLRLVRKGVDIGVMEQKKFRVTTKGRGVYPVWHYRSKKA